MSSAGVTYEGSSLGPTFFNGLSPLGQVQQIQHVRSLGQYQHIRSLGEGEEAPPGDTTGSVMLAVGTAAGVAGASVYGGLVGGMAAGHWRGVGTGALVSGGLSAIAYGVTLLMGRFYAVGGAAVALGLGGTIWAGMRWNKTRKGRK